MGREARFTVYDTGANETIKEFELGYFPEKWEAFSDAAIEKGYDKKYLLEVGLSKEKNGKIYDAYRGRVIFPIHNLSGRVLDGVEDQVARCGSTKAQQDMVPKTFQLKQSGSMEICIALLAR